MKTRSGIKRRYIVVPNDGLTSRSLQAAALMSGAASALTASLSRQLSRFASIAPTMALASAPTAETGLSSIIAEDDFELLSQRFDDGPALVAMTHAARLAFEAGHPDLRVVPVTRYHLPGHRVGRARTAGGDPAAESAVRADGTVFDADAKRHFLGADAPGAQGDGVLVGVIDTGIDANHPALRGQVTVLRCLVPGAPPTAGGPVDWGAAGAQKAGHGTHVAGIVAAAPGFDGPAGVAPRARLISYRVFPDDPSGPKAAENIAILDAIRAAIADGCQVVNLSIEGSGSRNDGVRTAIADAWKNGVLCVAAAGNGFGNPVSFPAALEHCVAVTAIGREGAFPDAPNFTRHVSDQRAASDPAVFLASFSNFGPQVQFAAPGHAIVSTFPGGQWWFDSGTSMAAPFIAGILARLLSDNTNILRMAPDATRSGAMLQMLIGRARMLGLPQVVQEGYGLPA